MDCLLHLSSMVAFCSILRKGWRGTNLRLEHLIILAAFSELAIDKAHKINLRTKAELAVGGAVDVLLEHITHPLLSQVKARKKLVIAPQRHFKL